MWQKKENQLYKKFEFKDFTEAIEFIGEVAKLANKQNHHPKIVNEYNKVELWLITHSEKSITQKDKDLANEIDQILDNKSLNMPEAKLFTDGGSRGNPGPSAIGFVILDMEENVVKKGSKYLGETTNNQAEYLALIAGLEKCHKLRIKKLNVFMDSLLIVNQINGLYKIKNAELLDRYKKVRELCANFEEIEFTHVPRAMNSIADGLVNDCLDGQANKLI